ncbi:MAG: CaiB/BaiF CoA-transferase family protein [Microbacteriaceae bacterium]
MSELLKGYRVIESSMLLNGASTAVLLADLGADVVKVESPFLGDYLRTGNMWFLHVHANKNKRSIAIDLRKPEGRDVFYRLLETADVVVTNAIADKNDKLGIGYDQLRERKPDIVYCQNTGFGATGPYARIPAHGQMMDSVAGAMPVELDEEDFTRPRRPDGRSGALFSAGEATATSAVYAAFHIAAALAHRAKTGEGAYIDVAAADAVIASAWPAATGGLRRDQERPADAPMPDRRGVARYQSYETGDHKFVLFCPEEHKFWTTFCTIVDRPDLLDQAYGIELRREVQAILRTKTQREWIDLAIEHGLPIGPIHNDVREVFDDPQIRTREIFHEAPQRDLGSVVYLGEPAIVRGQPYEVRYPAPRLGEHTDEILGELGYSAEEIGALAAGHVTTSESGGPIDAVVDVYGDESRLRKPADA